MNKVNRKAKTRKNRIATSGPKDSKTVKKQKAARSKLEKMAEKVKLPQVVGKGGEANDEPEPGQAPFDPQSVVANILKKKDGA